MGKINVLSKQTIDQIAAGEVIERPKSVVKELVENAIDAGATAISVETRNGGIDLVRVTDNGPGIEKEDVPVAFRSHATSKIREASDLSGVLSLGFRGEALSSIASVSEVQMFTKTREEITGTSYLVRGGEEISEEEVGTPDGTTMIVRELFYNTPARRKFLKSPMTENSYIGDQLEKCALSHPEIRFKWTSNGQIRLSTSGNGNVKDLIYAIFGRETAERLLEVSYEKDGIRILGYVGKPDISRGSRSFENYFVNGRFVKSRVIDKAIEDAFQSLIMQHRYPFAVLYLTLDPESYDVNVHPTKLELRFRSDAEIYDAVLQAVREAIRGKELIPDAVKAEEEKQEAVYTAPEPFERPEGQREDKGPQTPVFKPERETVSYTDNKPSMPELREKSIYRVPVETPETVSIETPEKVPESTVT
ncbi:MAG: DNA mismatch repair endonuclease MutL, partial [Lachnospiraceae bacterium]|nr:DNA mismatch repair endonuclease MutL [Lachnospiraceae bacterium]